jgi:hypothetical protein
MHLIQPRDLNSEAQEGKAASRLLLVSLLLIACACGGGATNTAALPPTLPGVVNPTAPASAPLSGIVLDESNEAPVPGAVVRVDGVAVATAAQDGQVALGSVSIGSHLVTVTTPGFDPFEQSISVQAGNNFRRFLVTRVGTFLPSGNSLLYLTPDIPTFRGVFVVLFGGTSDSRPFLRGDLESYAALPPSGDVAGLRTALRAFARANGFALMGMKTPSSPSEGASVRDEIFQALPVFSESSKHPELANAPLFLEGMSLSGCVVYNVVTLIPDRVIGFISMKPAAASGGCAFPDGSPAVSVPGYFFLGELDSPDYAAAVNRTFDQNRGRGAVWAVAIERGTGHVWVAQHGLIFAWASAVLAQRLPPTVPPGAAVALRPLAESSGWLGDRTSFSVAGYPCFSGEKGRASWLPSERTARDWQSMMGSGATVLVCP